MCAWCVLGAHGVLGVLGAREGLGVLGEPRVLGCLVARVLGMPCVSVSLLALAEFGVRGVPCASLGELGGACCA